MRSAVEGVCMQLALVALALDAAGVQVREVRATGGAMESPVWRDVLSAALDLPVGLAVPRRRAAPEPGCSAITRWDRCLTSIAPRT